MRGLSAKGLIRPVAKAYYNSKCYEQDVRNRLKCAILCNTEPYVNIPGNPHMDEKITKLRVDGFSPAELDAIAAGRDVRIGAVGVYRPRIGLRKGVLYPSVRQWVVAGIFINHLRLGITTVNSVAVQRIANPTNNMSETWLEVKFTVNQGVHGCQAVVVGEHTLPAPVCSPIPETFLKLISDAPDMYVGQKVFVGMRVAGTTEPLSLMVTTSGTSIDFPGLDYQRFNLCPLPANVTKTSLTLNFPGGCYNFGSLVDEAIGVGAQPFRTEPCTFWQESKKKLKCEISLKPGAVKPSESTEVTVTVTKDGKIIEGVDVTVRAEAVEHSGGHQHNSTRPVGEFSAIKGATDKTGKFVTTYTASAFGGEEKIIASVSRENCEATLNVRIPDLLELEAGTDYELVGETTTHPKNHFGTKKTLDAIKAISTAYHKAFPKAPLLEWNDISLVKGGLFDVNGDWSPPHKAHRVGNIVDLRIVSVPEGNREALKKIIKDNGGSILEEKKPPHWHITFK